MKLIWLCVQRKYTTILLARTVCDNGRVIFIRLIDGYGPENIDDVILTISVGRPLYDDKDWNHCAFKFVRAIRFVLN